MESRESIDVPIWIQVRFWSGDLHAFIEIVSLARHEEFGQKVTGWVRTETVTYLEADDQHYRARGTSWPVEAHSRNENTPKTQRRGPRQANVPFLRWRAHIVWSRGHSLLPHVGVISVIQANYAATDQTREIIILHGVPVGSEIADCRTQSGHK